MKSLFSLCQPSAVKSAFLYDYRSDSPVKFSSIQYSGVVDHRTTLSVVFDGETQRRFSSARIILYHNTSWNGKEHPCLLEQAGPVIHSTISDDHCATLPNHHALPQLTVACQIVPRWERYSDFFDLFPASSEAVMHPHTGNKSTRVLLDVEHPITPNTSFLSVPFDQSKRLRTLSRHHPSCCGDDSDMASNEFISTRIVRVVPIHPRLRPAASVNSLPTEILMHIFEAVVTFEWQRDLLSFAQVCRRWSCALKVLFARLEPFKGRFIEGLTQPLHHCVFAKALIKTPALGLDVRHLHLDHHSGSYNCSRHFDQTASPGFNSAVLVILRSTKHLQRLSLSQGYSSQTNTLFLSLPKLSSLRSLSITRTGCQFKPVTCTKYWKYSINSFQLGCCMARWPGLTSVTVEHLKPGTIGMTRRFFMRPPSCALTHLCIRNSYLSDRDLLYLTASSAKSLVQVSLEDVHGFTHSGLFTFLESVAHNLISLTIRTLYVPFRNNCALDLVVAQMPCLEVLNIHGDIASDRMFRRRSEMFVRSRDSGDADIPVVRLTAQVGPHMMELTGGGWPGWEIVEFQRFQTFVS